jgi:uncharacterized protein (TIGR03437 family)
MSGRKISFALFVCLVTSAIATSDRVIGISTRPVQAQSVCTPPLYQGFPSSCSNINLRWLNRDPISLIDHYEIYRDNVMVGQAPASAISFSEPVGCAFLAVYTIKQVMRSGASCQTVTTGNPPHTKPCDMCAGGNPGDGSGTLNVVSSASFTPPAAPGSIVTVFANAGQTLTSTTAAASGFPLPTNISGTQVLVNGSPTGLFYVSPTQINFLMPSSAIGTISLTVNGSNGELTDGTLLTAPNPAIFTANSQGSGLAAALVTADGQNYQGIVDAGGRAVPISVGSAGRPNYLVLFGTGLRNQGPVQVRIGGRDCVVAWSGPHSQLAGVDQVNVQLNDSLRGVGTTQVIVTAGGFLANFVQVNIGN